MTLDELETQLLIADANVDACMAAFRDDPVIGLEGEARRETYDRLRESERGITVALDEVKAALAAESAKARKRAA